MKLELSQEQLFYSTLASERRSKAFWNRLKLPANLKRSESKMLRSFLKIDASEKTTREVLYAKKSLLR